MEDFNRSQTPYDALNEKWAPVLDHAEMGTIDDPYKRKVTAALLENQERAMKEQMLLEESGLGCT